MEIEAFGLKEDPTFGQCPRCRNYLRLSEGQDNYNNLCDRCCRVLINNFPEHPSVYSILEFNRTKHGWNTDNIQEYIEKLKSLKNNRSNLDVFEESCME